MAQDDRQKREDRSAGLTPVQVALALGGAAGAWMFCELLWRLLQ